MTATPPIPEPPRGEAGDPAAVDPWPRLPVYPWSAFDSRRWVEASRIPIIPRQPAGGFRLHGGSERLRYRLTSEWDRVRYERTGVLRGEFVQLENGLMLIDDAGACIAVNVPDDSHVADLPFKQANDPNLRDYAQSVRDHWSQIPVVENGAVFSSIYHNNYYHLSLELLQKFRLIAPFNVTTVAIPRAILNKPIAQELMSLALGGRSLVATDQPMRFRNPVFVQAYQSDEGLRWLRALVGRTAQPGDKRYYVRRGPRGKKRAANNIAETDRFQAFLHRHQFIPIDFGSGELPLGDQIGRLDGVGVLLAPHGAGLTNIAYLDPPGQDHRGVRAGRAVQFVHPDVGRWAWSITRSSARTTTRLGTSWSTATCSTGWSRDRRCRDEAASHVLGSVSWRRRGAVGTGLAH